MPLLSPRLKKAVALAISVFYILLLSFIVFRKAYLFIIPGNFYYLYFFIMRSFDATFYLPYAITLIQIILNILHLLPLVLFIFRARAIPVEYWQFLFLARIIFDIIGHPYETSLLVSLYYAQPLLCLIILIQSISIYVPSYIICYRYAFRQDKYYQQS